MLDGEVYQSGTTLANGFWPLPFGPVSRSKIFGIALTCRRNANWDESGLLSFALSDDTPPPGVKGKASVPS